MLTQHAAPVGPRKRGIAHHLGALAAALFCGAVITQAYFEGDTDSASIPAPETAISLDAASVVGVLNAAFTVDGVRNKPRYPMEFETVLGPTTLKSFDLFASAAWPDHNATPILASAAPRTQPNRKVAAVAPVCAGSACRVRVAAADPKVLPPTRPAYLMPALVVVAEAQPRIPVRLALADDRRVRLLGLTLPGFVPTGDRIVKTVVSWSGTVADFVPRI
jgi:hypothetical protein